MNGQVSDHGRYDELAAGYALHALEPADERQFRAHFPGCERCEHALAEYTSVTAALADSWPAGIRAQIPDEPGRLLGERILAAVSGQEARPNDLEERRRRRRRTTAAVSAAAAALVIAGGSWAALSGAPPGTQPPAAGCVQAGHCRQIVLTSATSHTPVARVIVSGTSVWLVPAGLPADRDSRQIYVLWQITGTHTPLAVGSFDIGGHAALPVRIGSLAEPFHRTWAFAVSLEHGRSIPQAPSRPVALGPVSP